MTPGRALREAFDQEAFSTAIAQVIRARGVTDREAAREAGVSSSTVTRCIRGDKCPDVHTLVALVDWAELPLEAFARRRRPLGHGTRGIGELARILAALRAAGAAADAVMAEAVGADA